MWRATSTCCIQATLQMPLGRPPEVVKLGSGRPSLKAASLPASHALQMSGCGTTWTLRVPSCPCTGWLQSPSCAGNVPPGCSQPLNCEHCALQVSGFGKDLIKMEEYYQRYRICEDHLKLGALLVEGCLQRCCRQGGRCQPLATTRRGDPWTFIKRARAWNPGAVFASVIGAVVATPWQPRGP